MAWHEHIYHISGKISKSVNIIAKLKPYVTSQSLISIYYALVYPYLTYGCVLWGNNYEAPLSQLVRLQNKVVRIINNVPLRDHITPHYVNLGLMKLPDIVKLYTCQLFYDHLIDKKSLNLNLSLVSEQHNYATRSASLQHLNPESFRINIRKFCPTILGCYYWNDIPLSIRNKPTRKLFKKALLPVLFCSVLIIPTSNNFLLIFVIPTLYIYLLCVYSFLSSFLFILKEMYSIKGHIIRLLYLCPFHFFFTLLILLNILYSYLLSGKIKKYKIQIV